MITSTTSENIATKKGKAYRTNWRPCGIGLSRTGARALAFGTTTGRVVAGSSRGRIGNAIFEEGFDGSFVPCAATWSASVKLPKMTTKANIDTRILPLTRPCVHELNWPNNISENKFQGPTRDLCSSTKFWLPVNAARTVWTTSNYSARSKVFE